MARLRRHAGRDAIELDLAVVVLPALAVIADVVLVTVAAGGQDHVLGDLADPGMRRGLAGDGWRVVAVGLTGASDEAGQ